MSEPIRKSRKPANTAFKQQRLKSWQPILTPKSVLPTLFILGAVFAPIGGIFLALSDQIYEISMDYTHCFEHDTFTQMDNLYRTSLPSSNNTVLLRPPRYKSELLALPDNPNNKTSRMCTINFPVTVDIPPPVYLYYELTNFYQNHRSYVKSVSWPQLRGDENITPRVLNDGCRPLAGKETDDGFIPYYPCGLIANSIFNDTFSSLNKTENSGIYTLSDKNIGLAADKERFKKPPYKFNEVLPPPFWADRYLDGKYSEKNPPPDFSQDEHFHVWLRTAGLPQFRKLYSKNEAQPLLKGMYEITIWMNYNITDYGGRKSVVISTIGNLGGRNSFLGFAYISMGALSVLLGIVFTARHFFKPRKLGDHTYLSWNQQQPGRN